MAYIGRPLQVANLAVQSGTGDGSDTTPIATLDYATTTNGIAVYLDGVRQLAGTDYNVTSQTTLTFTTAPANGVGVDVYFLGLELSLPTPADGTVATAKIANNAVDETKLKDALIGDFTDATVTASDYFLHGDATDSGNTKKDTVQGILDLAGGGATTAFISATYNVATASGTADYTSSSFGTPTGVIMWMAIGGTAGASGMQMVDASSNEGGLYNDHAIVAGNWIADNAFTAQVSSGNYASGVSAYITDGIRITWSKTGSPTGTATLKILLIK